MPKRGALRKAEIRWLKVRWSYQELVDGKWVELMRAWQETKPEFIKRVAEYLNERIADGAVGFSLRIKGKNGQLQEERTYPKSADPRSKG